MADFRPGTPWLTGPAASPGLWVTGFAGGLCTFGMIRPLSLRVPENRGRHPNWGTARGAESAVPEASVPPLRGMAWHGVAGGRADGRAVALSRVLQRVETSR